MKLTSSAFKEGAEIPRLYTCQGKDFNPPLEIRDVPAHTKSLVLIMEDPDVPSSLREDQLWIHWVVFNLSPNLREIAERSSPPGVKGRNTGGRTGYMGPCPPDRRHRYFFKLYALNTLLSLTEGATREELLEAMEGHILAKAELMGTYEKR